MTMLRAAAVVGSQQRVSGHCDWSVARWRHWQAGVHQDRLLQGQTTTTATTTSAIQLVTGQLAVSQMPPKERKVSTQSRHWHPRVVQLRWSRNFRDLRHNADQTRLRFGFCWPLL